MNISPDQRAGLEEADRRRTPLCAGWVIFQFTRFFPEKQGGLSLPPGGLRLFSRKQRVQPQIAEMPRQVAGQIRRELVYYCKRQDSRRAARCQFFGTLPQS